MSLLPYISEKQQQFLDEAKRAKEMNDPNEINKTTSKMWGFYREQGYNPLLNFAGLFQIPVFIGMFRMCLKCSKLPVPGWENGGTLWFTNLGATDPYFLLPVISGVTSVATIWVCPF